MTNLPPGVEAFDPVAAAKNVHEGGIIVSVYGATKTGKTYMVARAPRPLYIVFLDPNANLDALLLQAQQDGMSGDIKKLVVHPKGDADITQADAEETINRIEGFARWARLNGKGTFVVDGTRNLKGYYEKAIVGVSPTLGYRPKKGERSPSTFEYAKSNDALRGFIQSFSHGPLDLILTWEGRPEWQEVQDERGNTKARKTGRYYSTMPDNIPFAVQAQLETVRTIRQKVVNNERVNYAEFEVIFEWNSFNADLYYRRMPAMGFDMVKQVLLGKVPKGEVLIPEDEKLVRQVTELDS